MIKIEGISKSFGHIDAVKNLSLEIKSGECFGFLGPNGAGKTTTIKMLVGLLKPSSGKVIHFDEKNQKDIDIAQDPQGAKSLIGYIPDAPFLYEKLTGQEFLEFIGGIFRVPKKEGLERIEKFLELFSLSDHKNDLIESYSHGMRQKLVMSSALLHEPQTLIVDEPMVGLDPRSARIVKDIFRKERDKGKSVFISTHTLSVAEEVCDRIGIINNGELIALGSVSELKKKVNNKEDVGTDLESIFLTLTEEETAFPASL